MLNGTWSAKFHNLTASLQMEILQINAMRVNPLTASQFLQTMRAVVAFGKSWFGTIALSCIVLFVLLLELRWIRALQRTLARDRQAVHQALVAIEHGSPPQVWLSMLDR